MDIILKQDIPSLGHKDDIITVKNGYARNYLIPKGLAINATASVKKMHQEILNQRAHKEAQIKKEAEAIADKMKDLKLSIGAKTSTKGKIFGSVNTIQLAESLKAEGFEIDRKDITIKEDLIKEVGSYTASVKLHREVVIEIPFDIIAE
jgi:large subunit ribosomal protein L9